MSTQNAEGKKSKQPDQMANFREAEIRGAYGTCTRLFGTGVFSSQGIRSPLFEAAVVQLLIALNDLMRKAVSDGKRIDFADAVDLVDGVTDVTDLITKCRNAACHIGSSLQEYDTNRFRFLVFGPGVKNGMMINGKCLGNDFDDDFAVYYGPYRLYLKRHALRAAEAISVLYEDVINPGFRS